MSDSFQRFRTPEGLDAYLRHAHDADPEQAAHLRAGIAEFRHMLEARYQGVRFDAERHQDDALASLERELALTGT